MIKVQIDKICAKLIECEPLVAGMIGKTLEVEFSADWAGLSKTAVFSNGDKTIDVMESEWNGNTITIPWEVLETPNRAVSFGIYGYTKNGDDIILAIPTLYTSLGRVYLGTNPDGDESTEPSLPVYAQLDLRVTDLEGHGSGGGIPEAPIDGKQYARQNGAWSEVQSGGDNTLIITAWLSDYGTPAAIIGTPSTTHAEIIDAIENGKDITLVAQIDDSSTRYNFDIARSDGDYFPVVFCGLIPSNDDYWGEHTAVYISVSPSDVWSISYDDYALKSDLGELSDLGTTDKSNIVAAINEVAASGGTGWTSAQIDLLEAVFEKLVYTDAEGGAIAAQLINSLRGGVVPEEPITITFDGAKAVISGLGNTTITYSGTTARIGYMPL